MAGMEYWMFHQGETPVAGETTLPEQSRAMGTPPSWMGYVAVNDVECVWSYPDQPTAIAGLMCSGPVIGIAEHAGEQAVLEATLQFLQAFRAADGGYRIKNVFRYVIGTPSR